MDARAGYDFLRNELHVPADHVVIYGWSLGSAVAVDLASEVPSAAVILEGAPASLVDIGQMRYPLLPVRLLMRNPFDSIRRVDRIRAPMLFIHSPEDSVVPIGEGRRLFDAARADKTFVEVRGGHVSAAETDPITFFGANPQVPPRSRAGGGPGALRGAAWRHSAFCSPHSPFCFPRSTFRTARPHHELSVILDPETHLLAVTDSVTLGGGAPRPSRVPPERGPQDHAVHTAGRRSAAGRRDAFFGDAPGHDLAACRSNATDFAELPPTGYSRSVSRLHRLRPLPAERGVRVRGFRETAGPV